jgi:hypothetical protein
LHRSRRIRIRRPIRRNGWRLAESPTSIRRRGFSKYEPPLLILNLYPVDLKIQTEGAQTMAVSREWAAEAEDLEAETVVSDFLAVSGFPVALVFPHRVGAAMAAHLPYRGIRERNSKSPSLIKQF